MGAQLDSVAEQAIKLVSTLSSKTVVLTNPATDEFKNSMSRWSEINLQTPSAIIKPASEADTVKIVKYATANNIPFVAKAGGYSPWSTTDAGGWILDLSLLKGISINRAQKTATVEAGVISKELILAATAEDLCVQIPSVSAVGYIPFLLGGGATLMTGMQGLAIDNLVSARVVTASNGLVTASATENPDLFWALKGAGQFFGIVTSVTTELFALQHPITVWTTIYLPTQIKEVASVLEDLTNRPDIDVSPGMAAIMASPGTTNPVILVNTVHFRPEAEADAFVAPLLALNPIKQIKKVIGFANLTDASDALNAPGGFQALISCGMQRFDAGKFEKRLTLFQDLVKEHPAAAKSFFMTNWYATTAMRRFPEGSTAYSHRDCGVWTMAFVSSPDETAARAAIENAHGYVELCQADQQESEKALFPNHTRVHSVEQRYRGGERLTKLKQLKREWDPKGIFTGQFI